MPAKPFVLEKQICDKLPMVRKFDFQALDLVLPTTAGRRINIFFCRGFEIHIIPHNRPRFGRFSCA
jgi:hypothetical protein